MASSKQTAAPRADADFQQIKVIRSHVGVSRFYAELPTEPAGFVQMPSSIPSPYEYAKARTVWAFRGGFALIVETAHKTYLVFAVSPRLVRSTEEQVLGGAL